MWDESKHPRDERGRFTFKDMAERLRTLIRRYSDTPAEDLFAFGLAGGISQVSPFTVNFYRSDNGKGPQNHAQGGASEPPRLQPAVEFNRLNTDHHEKHRKEMGFKDMKQYEAAAVEFFNSDKGELYYSERRHRFYRYDEKTGELAISSEGLIHTFNKYSLKKFRKIERQDFLIWIPK